MAVVNFTAEIEEIVGKLAGSVFQDSYGGFQIRTRVSPRNPQTNYQQLRRGEFGFITQLWRQLTPTQIASFADNAPPGMSGINFFTSCNVNLSLINQNLISSFPGGTTPAGFPMKITALTGEVFFVQASEGTGIVPPETSLLIFATYEKPPSKIFTNPSQFSPIISFPAGSNLSAAVDIASAWQALYGQFTGNKRICIKSAAISNLTGLRTDSEVVCAIESQPESYFVIDATGAILWDGTNQIIYQ